jgi:hypothetical protein
LRRVSTLAGPKLGLAYDRLNRIDQAVDGDPPNKRWGGSEDIGGSPRPAGTMLAAEEILDQLERAYRPSSRWRRFWASSAAVLLGLAVMLFWPLASFIPSPTTIPGFRGGMQESYSLALASLLVLAIGMLITRSASGRRPWVYGWRKPVDGGGWWLLPIGVMGAFPVTASVSYSMATGHMEIVAAIVAGGMAISAGEIWFRGLVHGLLVPDYAVQYPRGAWRLSRAAFASSLAYAVVATMMVAPVFNDSIVARIGAGGMEFAAGSLAFFFAVGLTLAVLRERSLSFLPGLAVQLVGFLVAMAVLASLA